MSQPRSEVSASPPNQQSDETASRLTDLSWAGISLSCRSAWHGAAHHLEPQNSIDPLSPQASEPISHLLNGSHLDSCDAVELPESRRLLDIYREQFAPHFPFIHISDRISACELRHERPWLYRSVLMIAAQEERLRQQELGKQIVSDIALTMLLRGDKSLDMLQALCVCNLWLAFSTCTFL